MTDAFDVAVIGAGPAGSSAAYHLARRHRRVVLLERSRFPRDKACGDGLGRRSVALLAEMGLDPDLADFQRVSGVRMVSEATRECVIPYGGELYGAIIPRRDLDHALARAAVAAGAALWQETSVTAPIMCDGAVCGVVVRRQGVEQAIAATFAVAADGALSPFARALGVAPRSPGSLGYAVRGYFAGVDGFGDMFSVYLPVVDPRTGRVLTGYGWVFPITDGFANIGVGYASAHGPDAAVNLRRAFDGFVARLRATDPRLQDMQLVGRLSGAPVPYAVDLARCAARGTLLVGDAAGLVDPLTGEGIAAALESGKLAAEVLDRALASGDGTDVDLGEYGRLLYARFGDRYEASRRLVGMSGFLWRLLENTAELERPVFRSLRRAIVGDGVDGAATARETIGDTTWLGTHNVEAHVARVRRELRAEMEGEFPLLSRVCAIGWDSTDSILRMQLVFVAAHFGVFEPRRITAAATAIELAHCALAMHDNVLDGCGHCRVRAASGALRWGNIFAVSAGDYLLARAHAVAAGLGNDVSAIVSQASARAYTGRMWEAERAWAVEPSEGRRLSIIDAKDATLFALACRLGARLSGASDEVVERLAGYGRRLGLAFALIEEVRDILVDGEPPAGHPMYRMIADGLYSWPVLSALRRAPNGELRALLAEAPASEARVRDILTLLRADVSLSRALRLARRHAVRAHRSLAGLPGTPARRALAALVDFVIDRATSAEGAVLSEA